ncbi:MAG: UDP-N-acetylmuramoyl-L-alanine--D-glutamate ligase [Pseudomonadota bacterium]
MIPITEYKGRQVAVFGLGRTGLSAAKALMVGGADVHAWDDNEATRKAAEAEGVTLSDINKRDWQTFEALILSPGVPLRHPKPHRIVRMAQSVSVPIVGDMELFARAVASLPERSRPRIVGITGTNGKSTTTALVGHILKRAGQDVRIGGNIGKGVLDLDPLHANATFVLELSSYQLDLVQSLHCDVAVFLNLTPNHLDRHGTLESYLAAKRRIFQNQKAGDTAVIGIDDVHSQSLAMGLSRGPAAVSQISADFALGRGVSAVDGLLFDSQKGKAERIGDLRTAPALPGKHNHQNAAAAYAACRALGIEPRLIMAGIQSFTGLAHRQEAVTTVNGVRFINDSKATNPLAAEQALKAYERIHWIAGGQTHAEPIDRLVPHLDRVACAYLIGESAPALAKALKGKVKTQLCKTLNVAFGKAVTGAEAESAAENDPGAVVLLSPAAPSFDQFKDFEARGEAFRQLAINHAQRAALRESA